MNPHPVMNRMRAWIAQHALQVDLFGAVEEPETATANLLPRLTQKQNHAAASCPRSPHPTITR
jgi:hypothetical protein